MRPALAVTALLAACLITSAAVAQNGKVTAQFESTAASGVVGEVSLNPMPSGETLVHAGLRGLVPNTEYVAFIDNASQACGSGAQIITFTANPAGNATWNLKVQQQLPSIESIGIRQESTSTLVACAAVPQ